MIAAEALASMLIALILPAILRRSRSTRDRLPSASERLPPASCWIAITMPKKFASATGTRSNSFATASAIDIPSVCASMIALNSPRSGSWASPAIMRLQSPSGSPALMPRTIDGVRKLLQEALDSAILAIGEEPARKAEPADEDPAGRDDRVARDDEQREGEAEGGDGADDEQFPLRPGQPRLCDPRLDRDLVAGLLTGLKLFEALRHLIAAIDRGDAVDPAFGSALDERLLPLLGARVARQQRIDEDIGEPAGGDRREHGSSDRAVHGMLPLTTSATVMPRRPRRRVPWRRGRRRAASPRHSSAPAPRSAGAGFQSTGAGR